MLHQYCSNIKSFKVILFFQKYPHTHPLKVWKTVKNFILRVTPVHEINLNANEENSGHSETDHVSFTTGSVTFLLHSVFIAVVFMVSLRVYLLFLFNIFQIFEKLEIELYGTIPSIIGALTVTTTGIYWILANPLLYQFTKDTLKTWFGIEDDLQDLNDEEFGGIFVG